MDTSEVLRHADHVLKAAKLKAPPKANFLEWGNVVNDAVRSLGLARLEKLPFEVKPWLKRWAKVYDNFDRMVAADPLLIYEPAHSVALEFHKSPALIRYFRAGNRTSKTQSGYIEHAMFATGRHPYRTTPPPPSASAIVAGLPFAQYAPGVFEAKFLTGEQSNALSPLFPPGGAWFYHYDPRRYMLTLACRNCKEAGKPGNCNHPKSTIRLFSCELGYEVLQGQAFSLLHFDEDAPEEMFHEGMQRIKTVPNSSVIITGTPLHGDQAWEQRTVATAVAEGGQANMVDPGDPKSKPWASLHVISQYDAGLVPHELIKADEKIYDDFAIRARIYGEPMPLTDSPVFDRKRLQEMRKTQMRVPDRGELRFAGKLSELTAADEFKFESRFDGNLRLWKAPEPGVTYVASVDTAAGLIKGDASCCSILKCTSDNFGVSLELVAQYHARINPLEYADILVPLACWYNEALLVIELTGGLGRASMLRVREHGYWNLYREQKDMAMVEGGPTARLGVETNTSTKPFMVAALQQYIRDERIIIPCDATIGELVAFEQVKTGSGGSALAVPKYQGAKGSHDDRVMSLAIACATALSYPQLTYEVQFAAARVTLAEASARTSKEMSVLYDELKQSELDSRELL